VLRAKIAELEARQAAPVDPETAARQIAALAPPPEPEPELADALGIPGFQPMHLDPDAKPAPAKRVTLFTIGDREYTVPVEVPQTVAVEFLHRSSNHDGTPVLMSIAVGSATEYLLTEVLGEDGYRALREYKALTRAQWDWVQQVVTRLALGTVETPKA
jgi:hypothetical protein